ncbi:MAG: ABC transporter ATP-binding protein [Devosiaceae bacterium]|nr:ABC transporter ATP-binding protein [Devosiaceae bacterium MH13]
MSDTGIVIDGVTKRFGSFTAVDNLNITFADGETACLLGPSGCGKTTLMRMIAGLETPTEGRIIIDGRDVTDLRPRRRNIGMVFQYPVMYQTLSVRENIALPLKRDRNLSASDRTKRVDEVLEVIDLVDRADTYIDELDAGSRQKVAVGRSVARQTKVVLFDEPTTNVEVNAKLTLIRTFKEISRRLKQTAIYVTHDQTEAMTLADRIALMKDGSIIQYDGPTALYQKPASEFGGWFLGNPGMNFIPAERTAAGLASPLLSSPLAAPDALGSGTVRLGIRPEQLDARAEPFEGSVEAKVEDCIVGIAGQLLARLSVAGETVKLKTGALPSMRAQDTIHIGFPADELLVFEDGVRVP